MNTKKIILMPKVKTDALRALIFYKESLPATEHIPFMVVISKLKAGASEFHFDGMEMQCISNAMHSYAEHLFNISNIKEYHQFKSIAVWFDNAIVQFQQIFWENRNHAN